MSSSSHQFYSPMASNASPFNLASPIPMPSLVSPIRNEQKICSLHQLKYSTKMDDLSPDLFNIFVEFGKKVQDQRNDIEKITEYTSSLSTDFGKTVNNTTEGVRQIIKTIASDVEDTSDLKTEARDLHFFVDEVYSNKQHLHETEFVRKFYAEVYSKIKVRAEQYSRTMKNIYSDYGDTKQDIITNSYDVTTILKAQLEAILKLASHLAELHDDLEERRRRHDGRKRKANKNKSLAFTFTSPFGSPIVTSQTFGLPVSPPTSSTPTFGTPIASTFGIPTSPIPFGFPPSPQTPTFGTPIGSLFGSSPSTFGTRTPTTPTFGTPIASTFGTQSPSFGNSTPSFGTPTNPTFGSPATFPNPSLPSNTFGAQPSAFGATTASIFGNPARSTPSTFGNSPISNSWGGFPSSNFNSSTFNTSSTSSIPSPTPSSSSRPTPVFTFGSTSNPTPSSTPASTFGSPTPTFGTPTLTFGNPTTPSSTTTTFGTPSTPFGTPTSPTFGAPASPSSSLTFGSPSSFTSSLPSSPSTHRNPRVRSASSRR